MEQCIQSPTVLFTKKKCECKICCKLRFFCENGCSSLFGHVAPYIIRMFFFLIMLCSIYWLFFGDIYIIFLIILVLYIIQNKSKIPKEAWLIYCTAMTLTYRVFLSKRIEQSGYGMLKKLINCLLCQKEEKLLVLKL